MCIPIDGAMYDKNKVAPCIYVKGKQVNGSDKEETPHEKTSSLPPRNELDHSRASLRENVATRRAWSLGCIPNTGKLFLSPFNGGLSYLDSQVSQFRH